MLGRDSQSHLHQPSPLQRLIDRKSEVACLKQPAHDVRKVASSDNSAIFGPKQEQMQHGLRLVLSRQIDEPRVDQGEG